MVLEAERVLSAESLKLLVYLYIETICSKIYQFFLDRGGIDLFTFKGMIL